MNLTPSRRFLMLLSLLLGLSLPHANAQTFPKLNGVVATDSEQININTINQQAETLKDLGAKVLILFVEQPIGNSLEDAETYFDRALEYYGFKFNDGFDPALFAVFVGLSPLEENDGQRPLYLEAPVFDTYGLSDETDAALIDEVIVPALVEGAFTDAFVDALAAAEQRINAQVRAQQAQQADGVATAPSTQVSTPVPVETPDPQRNSGALITFGVIVTLLFLFIVQRLRRARKTQPNSAATSQLPETLVPEGDMNGSPQAQLYALKNELSDLLIDLNSSDVTDGSFDPYLPDDPSEQTDMVLLSELLEGERSDQLETLKADYIHARDKLHRVSAGFQALQQQEAEQADLQALASQYQAFIDEAREVEQFTRHLADTWQALQSEVALAPGKLQDARAKVNAFKATYRQTVHKPSWPDAATVFRPLEDALQAAEKDMQANKPFSAIKFIQDAEQNMAYLQDAVTRLLKVDNDLDALEDDLEQWLAAGYEFPQYQLQLQAIASQRRVALDLLKQREYKVLDAQIDEVEDLATETIQRIRGRVTQHEQNSAALEQLARDGEAVRLLIEQSARTFDLVDDFAPENWRDIQGNGTEAQNAAERAQTYYEQALAANDLSGEQDFKHVADLIQAAQQELTQAKALLSSIDNRLTDLRNARENAQAQLESVEADVAAYRARLADPAVDKDVSEEPAALLDEAHAFITQARAALTARQVDWLSVTRMVQQAAMKSQQAMTQIEDEQAAMKSARLKLESEQQEAVVALARVERFVALHAADMSAEVHRAVTQASQVLRDAREVATKAEAREDRARLQLLMQAAQQFDVAEQLATRAFELAEQVFQEREALKQQQADAIATTSTNYQNVLAYANRHGVTSLFIEELQAIESRLPALSDVGKEDLDSLLARTKSLDSEIAGLMVRLQAEVRQVEDARRLARVARLEEARRQQALRDAQQVVSWGQRPAYVPPRRRRSVSTPSRAPSRSASRPAPRPISRPRPSRPSSGSSRRSGGGWGGSGRKSGGGW